MGSSRNEPDESNPRIRPATTPEEQENRMIALATSLAEQQMRDGTASTQVVTFYLKLATSRETAERKRIDLENKLLEAKTEQIGSQARSELMYAEAIEAFRNYSGHGADEEYDD